MNHLKGLTLPQLAVVAVIPLLVLSYLLWPIWQVKQSTELVTVKGQTWQSLEELQQHYAVGSQPIDLLLQEVRRQQFDEELSTHIRHLKRSGQQKVYATLKEQDGYTVIDQVHLNRPNDKTFLMASLYLYPDMYRDVSNTYSLNLAIGTDGAFLNRSTPNAAHKQNDLYQWDVTIQLNKGKGLVTKIEPVTQ